MKQPTLRGYRSHLAGALRSLFPGSERFGPPRGICDSLAAWCRDHQAEFRFIAPPEASPQSVAEEGAAPPQNPLFAALIRDGRVFGERSIAILTHEDRVIAEVSAAGFRRTIEEHRIFRQFLLPRVHRLDGIAAVLAVPGGNTYYHWLLDSLPRLELIRLAGWPLEGLRHFIVSGHRRAFQVETLERLKLSGKTVSLDESPHVRAAQLIVPSFTGPRERAPGWACEFLRRLFPGNDQAAGPSPRRIYISRARAKSRRVTNESEVASLLARSGFQAVLLEELSVADQARLFANAEWIVGPHGSGFANLVFCARGAKVLEIFSPAPVKDMYEYLARQAGCEYRSLFCLSRSSDPSDRRAVTVDLRALDEVLAQMV